MILKLFKMKEFQFIMNYQDVVEIV